MPGARWPGEPEAERYRRVIVKRLAFVCVLLLTSLTVAGCASGPDEVTYPDPGGTVPTSTISASPGVGTIGSSETSCSEADLQSVPLEMPVPQVVTAPIAFSQYNARVIPTEPGAQPRISGATAWQAITKDNPIRAESAELWFGTFRASIPFGQHGPEKLNVHAWVLSVHRLASGYPAGVKTPTPCVFTDAYYVIDSNTGMSLLIGH